MKRTCNAAAASVRRPSCSSSGIATFVTLLLVPVLYSVVVLDLKIVRWGRET
jgi:hypothetical protein